MTEKLPYKSTNFQFLDGAVAGIISAVGLSSRAGAQLARRVIRQEASAARARERIAAAGLRHAEIIVADASAHPFPPDSFELTFSRFGIMFFSDPVAAFANVRRAMKPEGRLALAVFRTAGEKLWPSAPLEAVRHLLPPIPTPGPEEPGPYSRADPARVHRILESAGFSEISLTPLDPEIQLVGPQGEAEAAGPLTARRLGVRPLPRSHAGCASGGSRRP